MKDQPMKDRYESKTTELTSKQEEQAKIDQDIAKFLSGGKKINHIANGVSGVIWKSYGAKP